MEEGKKRGRDIYKLDNEDYVNWNGYIGEENEIKLENLNENVERLDFK